ncbi:MAG TPA: outer membrane lipoprotein chaperone LolA [Rubrivivax sp.]|nr:outer membrane lipoprotein chaperone LolA [Rubrivivax sp.]
MTVAILAMPGSAARADAVDTLREFVREVRTGRASFTQTVSAPDSAKRKVSSGTFEFSRPNRFRFDYRKPFQQLIVADGQKVWIYDADLHQASSRRLDKALGATPAALLSGASLEQDFSLAVQPSADGLDWVAATPKAADSPYKAVRVGFKGRELAAVEITDSFGQRSLLQFSGFVANPVLAAETFRFVPPAGADVVEQ